MVMLEQLKIADFGLARSYNDTAVALTKKVGMGAVRAVRVEGVKMMTSSSSADEALPGCRAAGSPSPQKERGLRAAGSCPLPWGPRGGGRRGSRLSALCAAKAGR